MFSMTVTTTDDDLTLYKERDLSSSVIARVSKGRKIQLGAPELIDGREWMAATLDNSVGYVLGPSARGHTTLGIARSLVLANSPNDGSATTAGGRSGSIAFKSVMILDENWRTMKYDISGVQDHILQLPLPTHGRRPSTRNRLAMDGGLCRDFHANSAGTVVQWRLMSAII
jgi:hypothetical protein